MNIKFSTMAHNFYPCSTMLQILWRYYLWNKAPPWRAISFTQKNHRRSTYMLSQMDSRRKIYSWLISIRARSAGVTTQPSPTALSEPSPPRTRVKEMTNYTFVANYTFVLAYILPFAVPKWVYVQRTNSAIFHIF